MRHLGKHNNDVTFPSSLSSSVLARTRTDKQDQLRERAWEVTPFLMYLRRRVRLAYKMSRAAAFLVCETELVASSKHFVQSW